MEKQKTLAAALAFEGKTLHSGTYTRMRLLPASANTGIIFVRTDCGGREVRACAQSLGSTDSCVRRTRIGDDELAVHTIEHLMAVFSLLGVDNVRVEVDSDELPGMDGSAEDFYKAISRAGFVEQDVFRNVTVIAEPLYAVEGRAVAIALPYDGFRISYTLDYNMPEVPTDHVDVDCLVPHNAEQLTRARTFCLEREAVVLQQMGYGKGADFSNTLVIGADGPINNEFRIKHELACHKVMDMIGDLYLAGSLRAHIIALRCGHMANAVLVKCIESYKESLAGLRKESL
jgi:UDP-3-O-acyl N-acetylglucosamine deacetylase